MKKCSKNKKIKKLYDKFLALERTKKRLKGLEDLLK